MREALQSRDVPKRLSLSGRQRSLDRRQNLAEETSKVGRGHALPIPDQLGRGIRLVDRTNIILEGFFHMMNTGNADAVVARTSPMTSNGSLLQLRSPPI